MLRLLFYCSLFSVFAESATAQNISNLYELQVNPDGATITVTVMVGNANFTYTTSTWQYYTLNLTPNAVPGTITVSGCAGPNGAVYLADPNFNSVALMSSGGTPACNNSLGFTTTNVCSTWGIPSPIGTGNILHNPQVCEVGMITNTSGTFSNGTGPFWKSMSVEGAKEISHTSQTHWINTSSGSVEDTMMVAWGPGVNTVTTTYIHNNTGCAFTSVNTVNLGSPPAGTGNVVADFGAVIVGLTGDYSDSSQNAVYLEYDFDDGTTSHNPNPTHNFAQAGVYNVCQYVCNSTGSSQVCQPFNYQPGTIGGLFVMNVSGSQVQLGLGGFSGASSYSWSMGDGTTYNGVAQPNHTYAQPGQYEVCLSLTYNGNSSVLCDTVVVGTPLSQLQPATEDTVMCLGDSIYLSVDYPGASLIWPGGSMTDSFLVNSPGTYVVEISNIVETIYDTVNVASGVLPVFDLGNDTTLCTGDTLQLAAPAGQEFYLWSTGDTVSSVSITEGGPVAVAVTSVCGLSFDTIQVTYDSLPNPNLPQAVDLCPGDSASFDAFFPGATYLWHNGSTGPQVTSTTTELVWVEVQSYCGTVTDATILTVRPEYNTTEQVSICAGESYTFPDGTTASTSTQHISQVTSIYGCDSTVETILTVDTVSVSVAVTQNGSAPIGLTANPSAGSLQWYRC